MPRPGKFERAPSWAEALWDTHLDGTADAEGEGWVSFDIEPGDELFSLVPGLPERLAGKTVTLREDEQGFVTVTSKDLGSSDDDEPPCYWCSTEAALRIKKEAI